MRLLLSGAISAGLLISNLAVAAECARPAEHAALDIAGLKSQLMVTALTCHAEDRYNAFMAKYRPDLVGEERVFGSYFSRTYGRTGQAHQDDFVTQVANSRSELGVHQGSLFCDHNMAIFDEVMALKDSNELQQYAAGRTTGSPVTAECPDTPDRATRSAARTTGRHRS
jgi:hypothetical protein